jgi:hypothetical protein
MSKTARVLPFVLPRRPLSDADDMALIARVRDHLRRLDGLQASSMRLLRALNDYAAELDPSPAPLRVC